MVQFLSKPVYNKWYAEVRRISSKKFNLMDNLFFNIDTWPKHLIEIFVAPFRSITYSGRLKLATFFIGNGLSPYNAERLIRFYARGSFDRTEEKKMRKLFEIMSYVKKDECKDRYYYYSMIRRTVLYFNGEQRVKNTK